ncbi:MULTISPECIES: hypothetical protein [Bacillaceae]|uniref:VIT1/CCC1 family predicted Fe2+/Mn2+ transporter n=1 Tax=Peribacillus huizhouensis TaxID=1501239 RepID=A0ABR6CKN1_9BACI|nr:MULTISPECIES: hypothetical protein [Bacillaceae]MBA9025266.1 VIT1/CCC1 family predicted Fe2+/Mn2+ transporter [Peribacillus huizhouensis]
MFFFILSLALLMASFFYLAILQRPGMFPSKKIIKQRMLILGAASIAFLLIGLLIQLVI